MCADYTPSRKEQIEESFRAGYPLLDLPPDAWPGYMTSILRGSHEVPGELEIAPSMFGMVPHRADHKLARQTWVTVPVRQRQCPQREPAGWRCGLWPILKMLYARLVPCCRWYSRHTSKRML